MANYRAFLEYLDGEQDYFSLLFLTGEGSITMKMKREKRDKTRKYFFLFFYKYLYIFSCHERKKRRREEFSRCLFTNAERSKKNNNNNNLIVKTDYFQVFLEISQEGISRIISSKSYEIRHIRRRVLVRNCEDIPTNFTLFTVEKSSKRYVKQSKEKSTG